MSAATRTALLVGAIVGIIVIVVVFFVAASIIGHSNKGNKKSLPPLSTSLPAHATWSR
jgi:Na+-driven multidrug efflux pump